MQADEEGLTQTFTGYARAFQTLDPRAVVPYCHVPCTLVSAQGMAVMETSASVEALFARMMEALRARRYARSELTDLRVKQVSENIAFLSVGRARYGTDGQEMERLSETYALLRGADGWKIAVAVVHDAGTILALT